MRVLSNIKGGPGTITMLNDGIAKEHPCGDKGNCISKDGAVARRVFCLQI